MYSVTSLNQNSDDLFSFGNSYPFLFFFFFFNDTATTEIYTLSLHDALPLYMRSPLFADALPKGKTWLKLDLAKAAAAQGLDLSSLGAQSPTQTLAQLGGLASVTEVGDEQIGGADTTHYRGRIAKLPQPKS